MGWSEKSLKEKRGLGDCPQGVGFVFESKQKGFHAPFLTLVFLKSNPWGQSLKPPFFSQ